MGLLISGGRKYSGEGGGSLIVAIRFSRYFWGVLLSGGRYIRSLRYDNLLQCTLAKESAMIIGTNYFFFFPWITANYPINIAATW